MEYRFNTPLNGNIAMTYHYHEDAALRRDKSLCKIRMGTKWHAGYRSRPCGNAP